MTASVIAFETRPLSVRNVSISDGKREILTIDAHGAHLFVTPRIAERALKKYCSPPASYLSKVSD